MHGCLGEQFAFLQIKTIVSLLLHQFEITPVSPLSKPDYTTMVVGPAGPNLVRIRRRTAPLTAATTA